MAKIRHSLKNSIISQQSRKDRQPYFEDNCKFESMTFSLGNHDNHKVKGKWKKRKVPVYDQDSQSNKESLKAGSRKEVLASSSEHSSYKEIGEQDIIVPDSNVLDSQSPYQDHMYGSHNQLSSVDIANKAIEISNSDKHLTRDSPSILPKSEHSSSQKQQPSE